MFLSGVSKMRYMMIFLFVLLCGCRGTGTEKSAAGLKYPVDKTFDAGRKQASLLLAQNYINAQNSALKTGDFEQMKKVLPKKGVSPRAKAIFEDLKKRVAALGRLESCSYFGVLDCTLFVDHFWKYRFVRPTGDPRHPEQCYEVLYRIRVIYPDKSPQVITAGFLFK